MRSATVSPKDSQPATAAIPLRRRGGSVAAYAFVDREDAWLSERHWSLGSSGYAQRCVHHGDGRSTTILLHRCIAGVPGLEVDHINRDKLDNRRFNLRAVTRAQNKQNLASYRGSSSRYRGVSWFARERRWAAQGVLDGRKHLIGLFRSEEAAALAARDWRALHMTYSDGGLA